MREIRKEERAKIYSNPVSHEKFLQQQIKNDNVRKENNQKLKRCEKGK